MKQKIIVVVGPTASGKSALAVELARRFDGEVISADSRQVYKGLDIGTGKISKREMKRIPHHLLDVVSPKRAFSAGDYVRAARNAYSSVLQKTRIPIVVGGTGFYIDALLGRVSLPDVAPDARYRKRLQGKSASELYRMLRRADPARARSMSSESERNNAVRLVRALEIARALGKSPKPTKSSEFDVYWLGIRPRDAELKRRIAVRLRQRIRQGMVKEAVRLHRAGLSYKRMRELGLEYRSLARHLQGETTLAQMEKELLSDIWRYARKQIGYWKRNGDIRWFGPGSKKILPAVRAWLRK